MRKLISTLALATVMTACSATAAAQQQSKAIVPALSQPATDTPGFARGAFNQIAIPIMNLLMHDFGLTAIQSAGIVGNLAHESGGFALYQELAPLAGRGGAGWAQWTGPRRRAFENWTAARGLDLRSFDANYGFLKYELESSHKNAVARVRKTSSIEAAMVAFEATYERAGIKHYPSRRNWADRTYAAWLAAQK